MTLRKHGWPEALHEYLAAAREREFAYGTFDCALFAADAVKAMTDIDYAAQLRGYGSRDEAYAIIGRFGSIEAMITQLLDTQPKHPAFAHSGDVVLAPIPTAAAESGETIGICEGVHSIFPAARGWLKHPTLRARLAWSI